MSQMAESFRRAMKYDKTLSPVKLYPYVWSTTSPDSIQLDMGTGPDGVFAVATFTFDVQVLGVVVHVCIWEVTRPDISEQWSAQPVHDQPRYELALSQFKACLLRQSMEHVILVPENVPPPPEDA